MPEHIFVIGLDELNLVDLVALLGRARAQLESFGEPIDAIVGYWDFPVSSMVPVLAERFGVPSASLRSVVILLLRARVPGPRRAGPRPRTR